jgi:hypothetical protein
MKKYGLMLELYSGQTFKMWIYEGEGRFETSDLTEAYSLKKKYDDKNPKGCYVVKEIYEEPDNNI